MGPGGGGTQPLGGVTGGETGGGQGGGVGGGEGGVGVGEMGVGDGVSQGGDSGGLTGGEIGVAQGGDGGGGVGGQPFGGLIGGEIGGDIGGLTGGEIGVGQGGGLTGVGVGVGQFGGGLLRWLRSQSLPLPGGEIGLPGGDRRPRSPGGLSGGSGCSCAARGAPLDDPPPMPGRAGNRAPAAFVLSRPNSSAPIASRTAAAIHVLFISSSSDRYGV